MTHERAIEQGDESSAVSVLIEIRLILKELVRGLERTEKRVDNMEVDNDKLANAINNVANKLELLEVKFSHYIDDVEGVAKEVELLKSEIRAELKNVPFQVNLLWMVLVGGLSLLLVKWFTATQTPHPIPVTPNKSELNRSVDRDVGFAKGLVDSIQHN